MARKKSYGEGKTVKEIFSGISRNIGRVTESTLRSAVTRLSSAMNKRLDRAEKGGVDSPAVREAKESGGRFSAKGKGIEALKEEFIRLKSFFQNPTSTKKGWERVQKDAMGQAGKKGVFNTPPAPSPKRPMDGVVSGWVAPPGWEYDEESKSWSHPDHGKGWLPYEEEGGGMIDPITGQIADNTARSYHDYDASADTRAYGSGTETGEIWNMVDSLSKLDPRFTRQLSYNNPADDPRMSLFNAIDDTWTETPGLTFEQARDIVAGRLDEIYDMAMAHVKVAEGFSFSTYFDDEDDW